MSTSPLREGACGGGYLLYWDEQEGDVGLPGGTAVFDVIWRRYDVSALCSRWGEGMKGKARRKMNLNLEPMLIIGDNSYVTICADQEKEEICDGVTTKPPLNPLFPHRFLLVLLCHSLPLSFRLHLRSNPQPHLRKTPS